MPISLRKQSASKSLAVGKQRLHSVDKRFGSQAVIAHAVGETCIGVKYDGVWRFVGKLAYVSCEGIGTRAAVEAYGIGSEFLNDGQHRIQRMT